MKSLRNIWTVTEKELYAYFVSPIAYVVGALFMVIMGVLFTQIVNNTRQASLEILYQNLFVIMLFIAPPLTMRLLSEEQRSGSIELLLTAPIRDGEVVLGKFLAALIFYILLLAVTLFFPLVIGRLGNPDPGPIASSYLGALLLGGAYLAVGVLTSSLTQNQIVAAVLSLTILLILWIAGGMQGIFGDTLGGLFQYITSVNHYVDFTRGVIDTRNIVYFLSIMAIALFLATRILESRRYR
ncbi:MAG: ABC transporter permease subunit [Chloroflexi bacterium]|nr:ABC transporter permease subunit [Chloroflexota bacterium]